MPAGRIGAAPYSGDAHGDLNAVLQGFAFGLVPVTYSATMALDHAKGDYFYIVITDGNAFTINPPAAPSDGTGELTIEVLNSSGGAHGAATLGAGFVGTATTIAAIASTKRKVLKFKWNPSTSKWSELSRTADFT